MKFYNRQKEIEILNKIKTDFRIAVLGRRRIGKTRLIEHFYGDNCLTFFIPAEKPEKEIINDWSRENAQLNLPQVSTLAEFFEFVFFHLHSNVIFIDELQNVLRVNKSFIFDLQRLIDKYKPKLVVSGSFISMMKKIVQEYKSPLYGRFDYIIFLKEFDFQTIYDICRDIKVSFDEALLFYFIFGGIPKYYELIEKSKNIDVEEVIFDLFVKYPRPLYEEVRTMLKEEFGGEYKTFFSILSAISQGKNKQSEIANYLGRKQTEITKYLQILRKDFELIERRIPVVGGEKRGIYAIKNNIVSFWFGVLWRYNELIETGNEAEVVISVKKIINNYFSFAFENLVRELLVLKELKIPFEFSKIGIQWGRFKGEKGKNTYEIDIVALNEPKKYILFGECKWQEGVDAEKAVFDLTQKSQFVDWNKTSRKEYYAIFAKSFGKKVKAENVLLFDLQDMEKSIKMH